MNWIKSMDRYPEAFKPEISTRGICIFEKYRRGSDLVNAVTGGKVKLGSGHKADHWARPGNVEKEAWAQFGRIQYQSAPRC